jgi:hypothetical protein
MTIVLKNTGFIQTKVKQNLFIDILIDILMVYYPREEEARHQALA